MEEPIISVIIPTYNRGHFIGETLESLINQTFRLWECIVVDDGSEDYTPELMEFYVAKDQRIKFHSRPIEYHKGPNGCRNYGYKLSSGDYINWIDSDDILLDQNLEKKIKAIGEKDVVISTLSYIDENRNILKVKHNYRSDKLVEDYLIGKITFYTFTPLWSRSFLEKQEELFDERLNNLDDWDFNLRMLYSNPQIIFLDDALILYRVHSDSLSQEIAKMNFSEIKSEIRARRKHVLLNLKSKKVSLSSIRKYYHFILIRNKFFLREAFLMNSKEKYYLFINLIFIQFISGQIKGIANSFMALIGFTFLGKGYRFLK